MYAHIPVPTMNGGYYLAPPATYPTPFGVSTQIHFGAIGNQLNKNVELKDTIVLPLYRLNMKDTHVFATIDAYPIKPMLTRLTIETLVKVAPKRYLWKSFVPTDSTKSIVENIEYSSNCYTYAEGNVISIHHGAPNYSSVVSFQLAGLSVQGFAVKHIQSGLSVRIYRFRIHHLYPDHPEWAVQNDPPVFGVINRDAFNDAHLPYATEIAKITGLYDNISQILKNEDKDGWNKHMVRNRLYHIDTSIPYGNGMPYGM